MTSSKTTHMHCEHCGAALTDADLLGNTIDHPHDGYWCSRCCRLYFEGTTHTVETLRTKYGTDHRIWTVKAFDAEHAEAIARTEHATDIGCWVGEIQILAAMAKAA